MEIIHGLESNLEYNKSDLIHKFYDDFSLFFKELTFSNYVNQLSIKTICLRPEFDFIIKPKKPRFLKAGSKIHYGVLITYENRISLNIKYNFVEMELLSNEEFVLKIKEGLWNALLEINLIKKQIPDFNFELFFLKLGDFLNLKLHDTKLGT